MHTPDTRVLIIDDHQVTRSILRGLLRDEGFVQIREAADAISGTKVAQHFAPHLICLDVQMPGMSGVEALAGLKQVAPRAVIVMVTADSDRDTVVASVNAGAHGYIVKPFNAVTVVRAIEAALSHAAK